MLLRLLFIMIGGGVGAVSRYLLSSWVQRLSDSGFPFGTLAVNVTGCLLIGIAMAFFLSPQTVSQEFRLAMIIGVLGGFTTFSTFCWETFSLLKDCQYKDVAVNVIGGNVCGLAAVWFGYRISEWWFGVATYLK